MEDEIAILYKENLPDGTGDINRQIYRMKEGETFPDLRAVGMNDNISALWVHPRIKLDFTQDHNFTGRSGYADGKQQQVFSLPWMRQMGFVDNITSIRATAWNTQDEFKRACCRRMVTSISDQQKCGRYWGQGSADCGNLGCTGTDLKGDPICQEWCKKNPLDCDIIKLDYCRANPTDPYCGCIMDTDAAQAQREKYPMLSVNRPCWDKSDCQKTDLVNTFITTDLKNMPCPTDLNTQILSVDNRGGTMVGSNIGQTLDQNKNLPNTGLPMEQDNTMIWVIFFIVILMVIGLGVAIYFLLD